MPVSFHQIQDERKARAELWEESKKLLDKTDRSAEDDARIDQIHAEIEKSRAKIDAWEADYDADLKAREAELQRRERQSRFGHELDDDGASVEQGPAGAGPDYGAVFYRALVRGPSGLTEAERSVLQSSLRAVDPDVARVRADVSTGSDVSMGYTVPPEATQMIVDAKKKTGGVANAHTTRHVTTHGRELPIETEDDTANEGEYLQSGENHAGGKDPESNVVLLGAHILTSKIIKVHVDFLRDTTRESFERYLFQTRIPKRINRRQDRAFTLGNGVGGPEGYMTAAALGYTTPTGQTNSVTFDDVVELIFSVDESYRMPGPNGSQLSFADSTLKAMMKLKDDQGQYIWQPGVQGRQEDTIWGFEYFVDQNVAALGAGNKFMAFGDFSNLHERHVEPPMLFVFREKYMDEFKVGFLYVTRNDARLVDAGTNPIKYMANAAS